jgi:hypothetical protein
VTITTVLYILLTLAWCGLAFSLFVGADHLAARLRGRQPAFDWFDRTRWSGSSTPGKRRAVALMTYLAGAFIVLAVATFVLALIALALSPLLPDAPRMPHPRRPG